MSLTIREHVKEVLKERLATSGLIGFQDALGNRGVDPALAFLYESGIPVHRLLAGEYQGRAAELLLVRAREDPHVLLAGLTYIAGGHVFVHRGAGDLYEADGFLHLAAGVTEASSPRAAIGLAYVNTFINPQRFTLEQANETFSCVKFGLIEDSDTDVPGEIIRGGGKIPVLAWTPDGVSWTPFAFPPGFSGGGSSALIDGLESLGY